MQIIYETSTGIISHTINEGLSLERGDFSINSDQSVVSIDTDVTDIYDYIIQNGALVKNDTNNEQNIINDQARLRIQSAYSAIDETDEIYKRLREDHPDWTYMERDRILAKRDELISGLTVATTADYTDDSMWGTPYDHNNYFGFIGTTDAPASVTGTNTEPFLLTSETAQVRINDYSVYITRDPALPAQTAVDDINNNYRDITASVDNGAVKIESDFTGPGSELNIQDVSWPAYTALGITPQLYRGTRTVGTLDMSTDVHITRFLLTKGTWTVEHIPATGKYCLFFLIHPDSEPISKIHDGSFDITDVFDMQTYTHNGADYRYYIMDPKHAVGSDYNNTILEITI